MADLVATGIVGERARMRAAAREGFATATDLADYLVRKGMPFRDAHEAVARAVRDAEARRCDLPTCRCADLRRRSRRVIDDDVFGVLTLEGSVRSRDHPAAPRRARCARRSPRALRRSPEQPGRTTLMPSRSLSTRCVPVFGSRWR